MGLLAVGPLPLDSAAIAEAREAARFDHNFVPFATLERQLASGPSRTDTIQLVGNLLLLAPIGVYGPALVRGLRSLLAITALAVVLSSAIELGQLGLSELYGFPIRIADVDDVILNTAGVIVAYAAWRLWASGSSAGSDRAPSAAR